MLWIKYSAPEKCTSSLMKDKKQSLETLRAYRLIFFKGIFLQTINGAHAASDVSTILPFILRPHDIIYGIISPTF